MIAVIRSSLGIYLNGQLVDELLEAYSEAKRNFYEGGHRLNAVEGGRFCEAAWRLLEERTHGSFMPLGQTLNTEAVSNKLANLPVGSHPESVRLHIPRSLRVVYDIRNKRNAAHLADGIDPNLQDATLVIGILDWVLAEFVRLYHGVGAGEAQKIVEDLVTRRAPIIEEFDGFLKVLRTDLGASDLVLVLMYHRGQNGATLAELKEWVKPAMRPNLKRTTMGLVEDKAFLHFNGERFLITLAGKQSAEQRRLFLP